MMECAAPPSAPPHQQYEAATQWLEAALAQLHSCTGSVTADDHRRAAEAALLQFRRSDAAWSLCLHLLSSSAAPAAGLGPVTTTPNLLLFAAQTLRGKINEQGSSLPDTHKEQLKQTLLQLLLNPGIPPLVLRQVCLALAALASLLPQWDHWLQPVGASLPWRNAVQLLHDTAEEGSSDWRHVAVPGLTSSEKLSWATSTRERFRSWAPAALQLLHAWLQQQQQQQAQQPQQAAHSCVCMLDCLTAWVKLGALHHVSQQVAHDTGQLGLLQIQSQQEEVVGAALALLTELPEYAPEQLLQSLQPHMLQVASAAVRAAAACPPDLMHASAWASAFAAYTAVVPQKLLAAPEDDNTGGQDVRQALLQVAALPQEHNAQLICLPALRVWANVLANESPSSAAVFAAAGGGTDSLSRASTAADADEATAIASIQDPGAAAAGDASGDAIRAVPYAITSACHHLLLHAAHNCMLWAQTAQGWEAIPCLEAAAAIQDLFLAVCCVIGQQQYLQVILYVWGDPQLQQHPQKLPWLQDASLSPVLKDIDAAPGSLRLQVAVDMAAAAAAVGDKCSAHSTMAADDSWQQASSSVARLLSQAAAHMQEARSVAGGALDTQLALSFCKAVQACSNHLAHHFSKQGDDGAAGMGGLLRLLVGMTPQAGSEGTSRSAAAAAARALTSAALHLQWDKLYLGAPVLMQAVQDLSGVDSAEQDLFASLAMCLAAVGAPDQELQALRSSSIDQLILPAVRHLENLLQQLQTCSWAAMGKPADAALCHHMVRVRVVLEAAWQRQEQQQTCHDLAAAPEEVQYEEEEDPADRQGHSRKASVASGMEEDASDGLLDASWPSQHLLHHHPQAQYGCDYYEGSAEQPDDPSVQMVLTQLWPLLHALAVQHGGSGRFLQHYAKCCSKLLKIQPELLLKPQQQLQQFLEVAVAGLVRPHGCGLAEPLLMAVELCCQQQGSGLLLEAAPCITQVYAQLWCLPEVLALRQPGVGDAQPDLTEVVFKLSTAFLRHCSILQPSSTLLSVMLPSVITAAATCAGCCHKRVGSCALATLLALLAAAAEGAAGGQQCLVQVVVDHGPVVAHGALGALLVPAPLPRLQKVSSILLELATLANTVEQLGGGTTTTGAAGPTSSAAAGSGHGLDQQQLSSWANTNAHARGTSAYALLQAWLSQATQRFTPTLLTASEAAELATTCAALLAGTPGGAADVGGGGADGSSSRSSSSRHVPPSRSYVVSRRLKKRMRDFAEKHMRSCCASVTQG